MSEKITRWLNQLDLGQYANAFTENAIDWNLLAELDQDTLKISVSALLGTACAFSGRLPYSGMNNLTTPGLVRIRLKKQWMNCSACGLKLIE